MKPRRCPACSSPMTSVSVTRYLINGFVPSGSLYDFHCDCGHTIGIESIGRVLRWFVLGVFFMVVFLAARDEGGFMPWLAGILGVSTLGLFGHEVLKRIRAPEIE